MLILVAPIAFLEQPGRAISLAAQNAWLTTLATLLSGALLVLMFSFIIKKSKNPFPYLLEEHFGIIIGKFLSLIYLLVFLFITSYTLALFVNFITNNVLPDTPISILIGGLLFVGYIIIKNGLENFARLCEIIVYIGLPFSFLIIFLGSFQTPDLARLLPIGYISVKDFSLALASNTSVLGRLFPILTFAFFASNTTKLNSVLFKVLLIYIALITTTVLAITIVFGAHTSDILAFPIFSLVRLIDISEFINNVDIVFIGIWVLGIVGTMTIIWFLACFTSQHIFNLKEFNFLAAPLTLIIATTSLLMSENIIILNIITKHFVSYVYLFFFIFIPFLIFIKSLFYSRV